MVVRVIRESGPMRHGVDLWIDRQPRKGIIYYHVNAEQFTERQAQLLEAALNGDVSVEEVLAELTAG